MTVEEYNESPASHRKPYVPPPNPENPSGGLGDTAIIVIASVVGALLVLIILFIICRKRQGKSLSIGKVRFWGQAKMAQG